MILCELCFKRIYRSRYPKHINVRQEPSIHHFCSDECKALWMTFVREEGFVPKVFVEVIESEELPEVFR